MCSHLFPQNKTSLYTPSPLEPSLPIFCAPSTQAQNAADFACTQASTGAQKAVDVIRIVFFQRCIRAFLVFIRLWEVVHIFPDWRMCVFHPSDDF